MGISINTALALVQQILKQSKLTEVQEAVFRGVWMRQSYQEIINAAAENGYYYSLGHLKNTGSDLWQTLTEALGERVTKNNLPEVLDRYQEQQQPKITLRQDWGEMVTPTQFYGRDGELTTLSQWIGDGCRLINILGMGGMGKTSLIAELVRQTVELKDSNSFNRFEYVFWRSLLNAPPIEDLLKELLQFLSDQQEINLPATLDGKIAQVLQYARQKRCLLVLDNLESILQGGSSAGIQRQGYEGYGLLIQRMGEVEHQSCLILTSREKPREIAWLEGVNSPVRSFVLKGLELEEGRAIFRSKGCFGIQDDELQIIFEHYAGNPLALNMVASGVQELFDGDLTELMTVLRQGSLWFDDINDVLTRQFNRLSAAEQEVMYWLAINREPVSMAELKADIVAESRKQELLIALQSLQRRCLVERNQKKWSLQPVVMEYVTGQLVAQVCQEILKQQFNLFRFHALLKAQGKDYIRQAQSCLVLQPILDELLAQLGSRKNIEYYLRQILEQLRIEAPLQPGYVGGNVLNLLREMNADLSHINCSYLSIWQAYLQGANLHQANFSHANFSRSIFTETLDATLSVAFSPDGNLFATGNADGKLRVWQVTDGRKLLTCEEHSSWIASVAFSPDSQMVATASFDQTIKIWSLATGQCLKTLRGHTGRLWTVRFSPDGQWLASAGDDQTIKLWDLTTGNCVQTFIGHKGCIWTVNFTPEGNILASGGDDHSIRLWDIQTGQLLHVLQGHTSWVRGVVFCPDRETLVSASSDHTVKLWNIKTGTCFDTLKGHHHLITSVALSSDGRTLASGSQDCTVRIWDLITGQCLRVLQGHPNGIWSVAFHPDGQTLISGSNDSTVKLWNVCTGQSLKTIQGYSNGVRSVSFDPTGQLLASAGDDKQIKLWQIQSGELLHTLPGHTSWIWSVAFSPDGSLLASGSNDCSVKVWQVTTGQVLHDMKGHTNLVMSVAFSPERKILASGCTDQTIKLWDLTTGNCVKTLACTERVWTVAFLDSDHLISGHDDNTAKLWNLSSGTCLYRFEGHTSLVFTVAISPDQQLLATGSQDQTIKLWDLKSKACLQTFSCHSQVWSIAFSTDGKMLVSGTSDKLVRLWDVCSGECISILSEHESEVWATAVSPTASIIASGGQLGAIHLWNLETKQRLKTLQNQRLYEAMNIMQVTGLTLAEKNTLKTLGAIETC